VTGKVISAIVLHENDDVTFITASGHVVRLKGDSIPVNGRTARGVRLIRLAEGDTVAAVTSNSPDDIPVETLPESTDLEPETEDIENADEETDEDETEEITEDSEADSANESDDESPDDAADTDPDA